ncbi:unnamed protein product [Brassica oleracea]
MLKPRLTDIFVSDPASILAKVRVFSRTSLTRLRTSNKYNLFLICYVCMKSSMSLLV